ncbi:E3 ubiquitin-protein ligase ATL42-like [Syzygium oleosum]|uniref:E3 ubiquitin-protein ligase ATL42-like n=1 Tax=Syzygium oleosum TaxID=219896 RepID=UPI0024B9462B|nr:E3 ubiquitin-protein ligase ATL42-like [Syzygium oleosum]
MRDLAVLVMTLSLIHHVKSQENSDSGSKFPHLNLSPAVIIGILSVMFTLILLVLVYVKFFYRIPLELPRHENSNSTGVKSRSSGFEKSAIDALPFFRFSSLQGSKQGLECSICLSKFRDIELLQSLRFGQHSFNLSENPGLPVFIQREQDDQETTRLGLGSRTCDFSESNRVGHPNSFHKFKHKIILSDMAIRNRWSDINSSDLLFLSSEMLHYSSSERFSPLESSDGGVDRNKISRSHSISILNPASSCCCEGTAAQFTNDASEKRSMSEIVGFSRFAFGMKNGSQESAFSEHGQREEQARRLWLSIARQTVRSFARKEIRKDANVSEKSTDQLCT